MSLEVHQIQLYVYEVIISTPHALHSHAFCTVLVTPGEKGKFTPVKATVSLRVLLQLRV